MVHVDVRQDDGVRGRQTSKRRDMALSLVVEVVALQAVLNFGGN